MLTAALELLAQHQRPDDVSVAAIVRRADCHPPALYHYFADKDSLLRAACIAALDDLADRMERAATTATDPLAALERRAGAYLDFAFENPAVYRVLFMGPPAGPASADHDLQPGRGLRDLSTAVERCLPLERQGESLPVAFGVWASMHGLASLHLSNAAIPRDSIRATLVRSVHALLTGAEHLDDHLAPQRGTPRASRKRTCGE